MSDNKKYYYIRIKDNFYDTDDIKLLQSMDNGYLYSDILMKLYLKSLKNNGRLMFKAHIPYNAKMISTITGHNIAIVEKALMIFQNIGLIEILDNGAIYMLDIQNFIGKSSTDADRKREFRRELENEKQALLQSGNLQSIENGQMSDKTPPEIEIEIEIETELDIRDKDKVKDKVKDKNKSKKVKHKHGEYNHVLLTDEEFTKLKSELGDCMALECVTYLDEYMEMTGKTYKSCYLAIKKWVIKAVNEEKQNKDKLTTKSSKGKFNNYEQRNYDFNDLERKLLGWEDAN